MCVGAEVKQEITDVKNIVCDNSTFDLSHLFIRSLSCMYLTVTRTNLK